MDRERRKAAVTAYMQASAMRDFEALRRMLPEDFRVFMTMSVKDAGLPFPLEGREAFIDFLAEQQKRPTRWKVESSTPLEFFFDDADSVAVRARIVGAYPSGFPYDNEYVFILRFEGEVIVELREFTDTRYIASLTEKAAAYTGSGA
jgi:ketosteroid isomerase-like protein